MSLYRRLKYVVQLGLGLDVAGHEFTVFPDDVFLVSYPKSGNTWTRFLVANLAHPEEPANFANINRLTPDPEAASRKFLKSVPRPRILKSHLAFRPAYKRVIYIVRDPRDVALSEYHFSIKTRQLDEGAAVEPFVKTFVTGQQVHADVGSWGENVASWLAARGQNRSFLLIRYEDLLAEPVHELAKIAAFIGIEAGEERLTKVVELSSADAMRELEKSQAHLWSSTKETRKDKPFVRAAKSGGWKAGMPASSVALIESAWAPLMKMLGYKLNTEDLADTPAPQWAKVETRTG